MMKDTDETVEVEDENQFGGEDGAESSPDLPTRPVPPPALPAAKVISTAAVVDADAQDPPAAPARGQILSVDSQLGGDSSAAGQARPPISGGGSVKEFIFKLLGRANDPMYNPIDRYEEEGVHAFHEKKSPKVSPAFVKLADQFADFVLLAARYLMLILRVAMDIAIAVFIGALELIVHFFHAFFIRGIGIIGNKIFKPLYHTCFHDMAHPFFVYSWSMFNGCKSSSEPFLSCVGQAVNAFCGPIGVCCARFLSVRVDYQTASPSKATGGDEQV